jgi:hypothetical protein
MASRGESSNAQVVEFRGGEFSNPCDLEHVVTLIDHLEVSIATILMRPGKKHAF